MGFEESGISVRNIKLKDGSYLPDSSPKEDSVALLVVGALDGTSVGSCQRFLRLRGCILGVSYHPMENLRRRLDPLLLIMVGGWS